MYFYIFIVFLFLVIYIEKNGFNSINLGISLQKERFILFLFFFIFSLLIALQYDVGTDYFSYVSIFTNENSANLYRKKKEYLFYHLSMFLIKNNLHPQIGFFVLSIIQFTCIIVFIKFLNIKNFTIFFYLYFTVSSFFFNQTNGIRQYTATCILLLSVIYFFEKKYIRIILIIYLASLFHRSAVLFIPIYFIITIFFYRFSTKIWVFFLLLSVFLIRINIVSFVINLLPFLNRYSHYLNSNWGSAQIPFVNILTKVIMVPFYLISLKALNKLTSKKDIALYQLGFFSFGIKLICLSSPILNRFVYYIEIFTILPLYYFFIMLFNGKIKIKYFSYIYLLFFICITLGLLFVKTVLFASNEYAYKSILFQWITG